MSDVFDPWPDPQRLWYCRIRTIEDDHDAE